MIYKKDGVITSDQIFESQSLRKVSINNIPYYFTISQVNETLRYELKYLDSPDSERININGFLIEYGYVTGRLYSLELQSSEDRLSNRDWEAIKKLLSESELSKSNDIIQFIKTLQKMTLVNLNKNA